MKDKTTFIHETEDSRIELSFNNEPFYAELVDRFKEFSLAIGFHPDTINENLGAESEDCEYETIEELSEILMINLNVVSNMDISRKDCMTIVETLQRLGMIKERL